MASTPPKKGKSTPGVRGPGGPHGSQPARPARPSGSQASAAKSPFRQRLERMSMPLLRTMSSAPKWLVVVVPAALLLLGLIQTGPLAWLGGVLLFIVFVMLAWLTALSWPVVSPGSRAIRSLVLAALLGLTILKFAGRY